MFNSVPHNAAERKLKAQTLMPESQEGKLKAFNDLLKQFEEADPRNVMWLLGRLRDRVVDDYVQAETELLHYNAHLYEKEAEREKANLERHAVEFRLLSYLEDYMRTAHIERDAVGVVECILARNPSLKKKGKP